jgi:NADH dehydrogenase FAD-containing subunit
MWPRTSWCRVLRGFEEAQWTGEPGSRRLLSVAMVGGGPTEVEDVGHSPS